MAALASEPVGLGPLCGGTGKEIGFYQDPGSDYGRLPSCTLHQPAVLPFPLTFDPNVPMLRSNVD